MLYYIIQKLNEFRGGMKTVDGFIALALFIIAYHFFVMLIINGSVFKIFCCVTSFIFGK